MRASLFTHLLGALDEWLSQRSAKPSTAVRIRQAPRKIFEKSGENIWWLAKKCVPLHSLRKKGNGSLAQLNRASDYGSEGCGFESRGSHKEEVITTSFFVSPTLTPNPPND